MRKLIQMSALMLLALLFSAVSQTQLLAQQPPLATHLGEIEGAMQAIGADGKTAEDLGLHFGEVFAARSKNSDKAPIRFLPAKGYDFIQSSLFPSTKDEFKYILGKSNVFEGQNFASGQNAYIVRTDPMTNLKWWICSNDGAFHEMRVVHDQESEMTYAIVNVKAIKKTSRPPQDKTIAQFKTSQGDEYKIDSDLKNIDKKFHQYRIFLLKIDPNGKILGHSEPIRLQDGQNTKNLWGDLKYLDLTKGKLTLLYTSSKITEVGDSQEGTLQELKPFEGGGEKIWALQFENEKIKTVKGVETPNNSSPSTINFKGGFKSDGENLYFTMDLQKGTGVDQVTFLDKQITLTTTSQNTVFCTDLELTTVKWATTLPEKVIVDAIYPYGDKLYIGGSNKAEFEWGGNTCPAPVGGVHPFDRTPWWGTMNSKNGEQMTVHGIACGGGFVGYTGEGFAVDENHIYIGLQAGVFWNGRSSKAPRNEMIEDNRSFEIIFDENNKVGCPYEEPAVGLACYNTTTEKFEYYTPFVQSSQMQFLASGPQFSENGKTMLFAGQGGPTTGVGIFDGYLLGKKFKGTAEEYYGLNDKFYVFSTQPLTLSIKAPENGKITVKYNDGTEDKTVEVTTENQDLKLPYGVTIEVTATPNDPNGTLKLLGISPNCMKKVDGKDNTYILIDNATLYTPALSDITVKPLAGKKTTLTYKDKDNADQTIEITAEKTVAAIRNSIFTITSEKDADQTLKLVATPADNIEVVSQEQNQYRLLGTVTLEYVPAVKVNIAGEPVSGSKVELLVAGKPFSAENDVVVKDEEITVNVSAPGYTSTITADGATLVSGQTNVYKVDGDKDVTFTIAYAKDPAQWVTVTITALPKTHGVLKVTAEALNGEEIESGAEVPKGSKITAKVVKIREGIRFVGIDAQKLTLISSDPSTVASESATFHYTVEDAASIAATLEIFQKYTVVEIKSRGLGQIKLTQNGKTLNKDDQVLLLSECQITFTTGTGFKLDPASIVIEGLEEKEDKSGYIVVGDIKISADFKPVEENKQTPVIATKLPRLIANPVISSIEIADAEDVASYTLFNLAGQVVKQAQTSNQASRLSVNVQDLREGIYIIRLQIIDGKTYTFKVVKQ